LFLQIFTFEGSCTVRALKNNLEGFSSTDIVPTYVYDRQTMLVYFTWPTKRPGGHQSQLTINVYVIYRTA